MIHTFKTPAEAMKYYGMEEPRFWQLVKMANWPNDGYEIPNDRYLSSLSTIEGVQLRNIVDALWSILDYFIGDKNPAFGGDDSHSDLLYHIIGLGQEQFYAHLNNYELIEARGSAKYGTPEGYQESFGYAVPYLDDWGVEATDNTDDTITLEEIIDNITEVIQGLDGKTVARIYNKICDNCEIEYVEDNIWRVK